MLLLLRSLLEATEEPPTERPEVGTSSGATSTRQSAPWNWVPFNPIKSRRPRKKRQRVVMFLAQ